MTRRLPLAALGLAAALLVAACGSDEPTGVRAQDETTSTSAAAPSDAIGKGSNGFPGKDGPAAEPGTSGDPDAPVSNEPADPADPTVPAEPGGEPQEVRSRDDLISPRTTTVESLAPGEDDRQVVATFWNGVDACYGAEATVEETADTVVVTVRTGGIPEAAGADCIDLAVHQQLTLTLDAPLGDRTLQATPPG